MNREDLIKKWLDNNLSPQELEAFKRLYDYESLEKLSYTLKGFKAPDFDSEKTLNNVLTKIKKPSHSVINWKPILIRVAAIFIICFGVYFYTTSLNTTINTNIAQKETITLPDASTVTINANSNIEFNKHRWDKIRELELEGEAFFKVSKGSKFEVITDDGTVEVLGTQFNVKQRTNYFEVVCYEGLVKVTTPHITKHLNPGEHLLILNGKLISTEKDPNDSPSWINNISLFKSLPYSEVIAEFERQYDVKVITNNIDLQQLFTGSFTHKNIDVALKSITLPLQLNFDKTDRTITLKRD
jgi:ferric-dicitrate binding protein FerR (iron transport regulator)